MKAKWLGLFLIGAAPGPLLAHPHIFVDAGFEILVDDDLQLTGIRTTWVYDEFYSLLITEDLKLDQDFDGVLTSEEQALLTGFDMNWSQGFNGDLVAKLNGAPLDLSQPSEATARLENGRIITTHLRRVQGPAALAGNALSLLPFDETYYTAYEVTMPVTITGADTCMIEKILPDIDDELAQMQQMLLRIDPGADLEENDIPLLGEKFATDIQVSCPGS